MLCIYMYEYAFLRMFDMCIDGLYHYLMYVSWCHEVTTYDSDAYFI